MRLVVFGQSGQVASELQRQAASAVRTLLCWAAKLRTCLTPKRVARVLRGLVKSSDAVINAAAYTAVDRAESESEIAHAVNGAAPAALAQVAAEAGKPFLHISTDYVFDGSGDTAWKPDDATAPLGVYGASKLLGEQGVRAAGGSHAILRTSWVFSAHGANFVKTMLRLGAERDEMKIVNDQIGGPTPAAGIASALYAMAARMIENPEAGGTFHYSGAPETSWAAFAREIFRQSDMNVTVTDIPASEFPTPAARPTNSRMDCSSLEQAFGIGRPDWRADLTQVLRDLGVAQAA